MKFLIAIFCAFLISCLLGFAGVYLYLPDFLRHKLESAIQENCSSCEITIRSLELSPLNWGEFILRDIHFVSGDNEELGLRMRFAALRGGIELWPLLSRRIVLSDLLANKFEVVLVNGDKRTPKTNERSSQSGSWEFGLNGATFKDGSFVYTRNTAGTSATLHIHDINIHVEKFGTLPTLRASPLITEGHFQIEKSGDLKLIVKTFVFDRTLNLNVRLDVRDQNLEDLNVFFEPNAGVKLKGILVRGQGLAKMMGTHLKASVTAKYDKFALKLEKSHDRSEVSAFFTNLGASIVMMEKNTHKPDNDRTREVETDRRPEESIVSFLLRGLKEAAIRVAKGS